MNKTAFLGAIPEDIAKAFLKFLGKESWNTSEWHALKSILPQIDEAISLAPNADPDVLLRPLFEDASEKAMAKELSNTKRLMRIRENLPKPEVLKGMPYIEDYGVSIPPGEIPENMKKLQPGFNINSLEQASERPPGLQSELYPPTMEFIEETPPPINIPTPEAPAIKPPVTPAAQEMAQHPEFNTRSWMNRIPRWLLPAAGGLGIASWAWPKLRQLYKELSEEQSEPTAPANTLQNPYGLPTAPNSPYPLPVLNLSSNKKLIKIAQAQPLENWGPAFEQAFGQTSNIPRSQFKQQWINQQVDAIIAQQKQQAAAGGSSPVPPPTGYETIMWNDQPVLVPIDPAAQNEKNWLQYGQALKNQINNIIDAEFQNKIEQGNQEWQLFNEARQKQPDLNLDQWSAQRSQERQQQQDWSSEWGNDIPQQWYVSPL